MAEKFSIVKQLDVEKLNKKIAYYVYENGHNPYIFINNTTWDKLYEPCRDDTNQKWDGSSYYCRHTGLIAMYQGYKVFEDNTLNFGEIELR